MATTPNYGWVTPAPTDFVTDLPADFEIFADAVDADLAGLLGGTTGQVLTKDSNSDHDFSWVTVGTSSNYTLLNTGGTSLTGAATITISGISNIEKLLVIVTSASSANASSEIGLRLNTDTGNNYFASGSTILATNTYSNNNFTGTNFTISYFPMAQMSDNASSNVSGFAQIEACKSTGLKTIKAGGGASGGGGTQNRQYNLAGTYAATAAITSVSVFSSTGNFDNGTIFVYGSSN